MATIQLYSKQEITNFQINQSSAKQMWSFSKAERFPKIRTSGCATLYTLPSLQSNRAASIGKGTKSDFTKTTKGKSAEFYGIKRDFELDNLKGPSYTFGDSREKYAKVYYDTNKTFDKDIPGPGKYGFRASFGDAPAYTMYGRGGLIGNKYKISPGPGAYKPWYETKADGKYVNSKIRNVPSLSFGPPSSQRFKYLKTDNTSCGFTPNSLMGKIFNSRYRSTPGGQMGVKFKEYSLKDNYPGPGAYTPFSELSMWTKKPKERKKKKNNNNEEATKNQEETGNTQENNNTTTQQQSQPQTQSQPQPTEQPQTTEQQNEPTNPTS